VTDLRAGLVGLGAMGRNHARILRSLPGVQLVGVAEEAGDPSGLVDGLPVVGSLAELIELGLDLCVVAAPTVAHEQLALELAGAGVPALVEKPLGPDVASSERIRDAFGAAGLVGAVGHIERYNPALRALRKRLASGELGELYQIATRRQSPFPTRIADVGVVLDLASHDLDSTSWVSKQRFSAVTARSAHKSGRAHEDLIVIVGTLRDGLVTNHLVNWLSPVKERVTIVTGEAGTFVADTLTADLTLHRNGSELTEWDAMAVFRGVSEGDSIRYALAKSEPLRTELEAFVAAVAGREGPEVVTMEEGVEVVRTAAAVLRAAATKQTVLVR
jgi:UDP-N-acetylglucosamine 3-dehydrogenase